jgi:hypothetical protein
MTRIPAKGRLLVAAMVAAAVPIVAAVAADEPLDPVHNVSLPCEAVSTPGLVPRSAKNIVHLANVCGFVGTDIEFQSRTDADGELHDYAFVGTMGRRDADLRHHRSEPPHDRGRLPGSRVAERRPRSR